MTPTYAIKDTIKSNLVPLSGIDIIENFDKENIEDGIGRLHISFLRIQGKHNSLQMERFKTQYDK